MKEKVEPLNKSKKLDSSEVILNHLPDFNGEDIEALLSDPFAVLTSSEVVSEQENLSTQLITNNDVKVMLTDLIKNDDALLKSLFSSLKEDLKEDLIGTLPKKNKKKSKEDKEIIYLENLFRFNQLLKLPASRHRERKDICFNDCRMIKLLMDEFIADAIYRKFSDEESVEGTLSMVLTKQNHIGRYNYHIISVTEIDLIENYEYTHCYQLCKNIYKECTEMLHDDLINWDYLEAVAKYLRNVIACNYSFIRPLKKKHKK